MMSKVEVMLAQVARANYCSTSLSQKTTALRQLHSNKTTFTHVPSFFVNNSTKFDF